MNAERVTPVRIDKAQAIRYAGRIADEIGCRVRGVKFLGGGSFGRAVKIVSDGESFVIKLLCAPDMMEKEVFDLRILAKNCPVPMPEILHTHAASSDVPVDGYAMSLIPGKSALLSPLLYLSGKSARLRFADEVTSALHEIHACTYDKFGDAAAPTSSSWTAIYKPFAREIAEKTEKAVQNGELSAEILRAAHAAWEKFDDIFFEEPARACLIHGDLNTANIMVKSGRVSGFIDPLNSMFADPEYDLFQFDNLTGKRFFLSDTYIKKYGASKNVRVKLAFYGLYNEIYCYFKAGTLIPFIMNPLVENMHKQLEKL